MSAIFSHGQMTSRSMVNFWRDWRDMCVKTAKSHCTAEW